MSEVIPNKLPRSVHRNARAEPFIMWANVSACSVNSQATPPGQATF